MTTTPTIAGQRWAPDSAFGSRVTGAGLETELRARGLRSDAEAVAVSPIGACLACGLNTYTRIA
jgi:hypothetical protein